MSGLDEQDRKADKEERSRKIGDYICFTELHEGYTPSPEVGIDSFVITADSNLRRVPFSSHTVDGAVYFDLEVEN